MNLKATNIKYKKTGLDWMPEIPEHWEVRRLKSIIPSVINGVWGDEPQNNGDDIYCIRVADFDNWNYGIDSKNLTIRNIQKNEQEGRLLKKGDLIIEKSGGGEISPVGRVVIYNLDFKAVTSNFIAKLNIGYKINKEYLYYVFRTLYNHKINIASIKATTGIQNLDLYFYFQNKIPVPPLYEQEQIVQYIQSKEEKINRFIEKKQRLIELLKEKRITFFKSMFSNLNKNWKPRKISYSFKIIGSGTTPDTGNSNYYDGGNINWINTSDLNDGYLNKCEKKITPFALEKYPSLKIYPKGTLLIALYGATIGKVSILNIEGCTNQACCALYDSDFFYNEFLLYWFIINRDKLIQLSYGGGQPNISQEIIRQLRILCPPLEEQNQIVDYIKKETAIIDKAIAKAEREIELMKEYKEAMISEAVKGCININLVK
jgi:type I restriction enzyme S subunit